MTKIRFPNKIIPPVYQFVFDRQRLLDILQENQHRPLVWVHGSPGAGKTTLISNWLKQQDARFLWYRMDKGINLCADLFYFLTLSAKRNYPRKKLTLPVFSAEYANNIQIFAIVYFRQLFAVLKKEVAIVFDNCQEIENDPDFFHILQIALNEKPEGLQIICMSRNRPSYLFHRLSLAGDLLDINPTLLQFTEAESSAFIAWLNPNIDVQTSIALQARAKGWAIALVLLSQKNPNSILTQEPAVYEQQSVFSFLMAEILVNMDQADLHFLAETAVFNQFTVTMADKLTGHQNTQTFLDDLVSRNLLVDRTNEIPPVYCYHPIFRDLLNNKNKNLLNHEQLNLLNSRALNILIKQKKIDEALPFYLQLQDWSGLKSVLIKHSESLINNGRHHAVITWIECLPNDMLECDPWLLFWYAVATQPLSPNRSAQLLDKCYQQFFTVGDTLGLYSTWHFAVEAITYSPNDFTQLHTWFQRFDELLEHYSDCPSIELKIKFSVTALQALAFYNPQHPMLKQLLTISEDGLLNVSVKPGQQLRFTELGHYYLVTYEIAKLDILKPYILETINDESLPAIPRISTAKTLSHLYQFHGNGDKGLYYLEKCLKISEQSAVPLLNPLIKLNLVGCHICRGDLVNAQNCLDSSAVDMTFKDRLFNSLFHFNTAWVCSLNGQLSLALEQAEQSLLLCQEMKNNHGGIFCLGLKARLLAETAQWEKAEKALFLLDKRRQQAPNNFRQLQYFLSDAWFGLLSKNLNRAVAGIKQFLSICSQEQIRFFYGWQPNVLSPLCILAIEHEIEVEHALSMMQVNALCPSPPSHLEQWPWPVRIYSFNRLQIELNGQLIKQDGKSQKKVLELLWTIITLGCQDVQSEQICDWLWPDSNGDLAQQALETAIFRLRKLIGKSVILVKEGRISINPEYCWVDVFVFETTLEQLDDLLQHETDDALLLKLTNRLFHLYQGPFLKQLDSGIVLLKQKQLHNKLSRLIEHLISYYEKQQDYQKICRLLDQSMARISQFESEYQELITYHQEHFRALPKKNN